MKAGFVLAIAWGLFLNAPLFAQKDDVKKQIVGKWEATLQDAAKMDFKVIADFAADGKLEVTVKGIKSKGTYQFVKDKDTEVLVTETTLDGTTNKTRQEVTITNDTMELKDSSGQKFKFKRVK